MNKYSITVSELSEATYIVEAETPEAANELFNKWADKHQQWIYDDLMDCCYGWDFSEAELTTTERTPDVTNEDGDLDEVSCNN